MKGKKMKKLSLLLIICALSSCSKSEKIYTVDEFMNDEALREKTLKECEDMSMGDQFNSTNCHRARKAENKVNIKNNK
ncbi:MAG: EexN family lipoprotein [Neisseriaceae bacterium]|nr:MAG: EexN family lipoprotein [Neisseriaceae bacterium]